MYSHLPTPKFLRLYIYRLTIEDQFGWDIRGMEQIRKMKKQECIPVGCLPSAAVAVCWGVGDVCQEGVSARGRGVCPTVADGK